jgi:tetratricopeptide (TPR) repeat protein
MSHLIDAIQAEARGDFRAAAEHYRHLTESGSPLDRIGIYQALARCHEKLGDVKAGGRWRGQAGKAYLGLPDEAMPRDERQYLALVEYRNAVQDLAGDPSLKEVANAYKAVLAENWKGGPEGLTHEGLFGGIFLMGLGDPAAAARYLFDSAEAISEQATEARDPTLREAARRAYELAQEAAMKSGNMQIAQVAKVRAFDLAQPQP